MADMISNCCEAEVRLSVVLFQCVLPSKVIKSDMCPVLFSFYYHSQTICASFLHSTLCVTLLSNEGLTINSQHKLLSIMLCLCINAESFLSSL